jgi:membrane-associated phospholipid phosphatase
MTLRRPLSGYGMAVPMSAEPRPRPWRARRLDPGHGLGLRLTVAAAGAFLVLVPFALLAVLADGNWPPLRRLDQGVAEALHSAVVGHPAVIRSMVIWSYVFDPNTLRVAALVLVIWLVRRGARRMALWAATTMTVGGLLGVLLKLLVGRHRPDLLDPVARAAGYSFPSGHALNVALASGVFLLVFLPLTRRRALLWAAAIVATVVTGLCRMALGVHWTSDVAGGWILGAAVVAATSSAFATWRHHTGRPSGSDQLSTGAS